MTMTIARKMPQLWAACLGMAALLIAVAAAPAAEAPTTEPPAAGAPAALEPAAGELLVASDAIQDPRFHHAVILLLRHDKTGAFGIVINRPLGERPIATLLAATDGKGAGDKDAGVSGTIRVFFGGPVDPQFGFVIHSTDYRRPGTLSVGDVAMTASKDVLRDIGHHHGPAKYLFAIGYAGWGAGQLEGEVARHDWFTAPAGTDLVFGADRGDLWQKALARRTREL